MGTAHGMTIPSNFSDRLAAAVARVKNPVLVGLDPRAESLPEGLLAGSSRADIAKAYVTFCNGVIDVVAPLVAAVKPQAAFFEALGPAGMLALDAVIRPNRNHSTGHKVPRRNIEPCAVDGRNRRILNSPSPDRILVAKPRAHFVANALKQRPPSRKPRASISIAGGDTAKNCAIRATG